MSSEQNGEAREVNMAPSADAPNEDSFAVSNENAVGLVCNTYFEVQASPMYIEAKRLMNEDAEAALELIAAQLESALLRLKGDEGMYFLFMFCIR